MLYIATYALFLTGLIVVLWLPGHGILRLSSLLRRDPYDRLAELCLGLGFWIFTLFALASIGQLHLPAVSALFFLGVILAFLGRRPGSRSESRQAGDESTQPRSRWSPYH